MNIVLFDETHLRKRDTYPGDRLCFNRTEHPRVFQHLDRILKSGNEKLKIGKVEGLSGYGIAQRVSQSLIEVEILSLDSPPPPKSPVIVLLALTRPKNLRRCLRSLANFGAQSIHVFHSSHVEKSYWSSPLLDPQVCRLALQEGLEVAGDTVFPSLEFHRLFRPFAEDVAPHLHLKVAVPDRLNDSLKFICTPNVSDETDLPAQSLETSKNLPRIFAIGPEAGFTDFEVDLFRAGGYRPLSLGSRVLTVENAIAKVLAYSPIDDINR